jgi:hypothetical protein
MTTPHIPGADRQIMAYAAERGITDILHFTTSRGLLGIFAKGAVLSRNRLDVDQYIEYIYTPNCAERLKDIDWIDYVNLSISRVNGWMFDRSERWHSHDDVWWAALSFDASLLAYPGVHFTTTNNTYRSCVKRGTGVNGLKALFAPSVEWGYYGDVKTRHTTTPTNFTTDPQAEVLYPGEVPLRFLQRVYVREADSIDDIKGWCSIFRCVPPVPVEHRPEVFQ